ncbi:SpoIIE family protein phosphatase [Actinoplanes subtropicus]|uniref:SpoIIE family protein phosphatase n=1 Tax=Actinoplanes subtropicus TaxID=543632 RepID=UPI0004C36998|nr:SpoIIE family protein phosphatase [Actinoplanes subtropicus]
MATLLVVDDDAPSRELLRTLLTYRGHQVEQASDGDQALAMAARRPPDVVITDVLMPGLDGYELARALRGEPATRHIPIVFNTAHYDPQQMRSLADACGVHDVILKPAQPSAVLATIDSLLFPGQFSVLADGQLAETQRLVRAGTWEFDPAAGAIVMSPELRDLLRLRSTRMTVRELSRRLHPEDVDTLAAMARDTRGNGMPHVVELRVVDGDGSVHEVIVSCRPAPAGRSEAARLWGVAQDVTRIRAELRSTLRIQGDWHAIRRTIDGFHRALLPATLPDIAGAGLAAMYLAAPERLDVGAAWYDVQAVPGGRLLLSVGKVAGHDQHPAAVMSRALAASQAYAHDDPDPVEVLARLNRFLADTSRDDTFVSAVVALFDPATGHLRVANGGHPPPVVIVPDGEGIEATLVRTSGPVLGVVRDAAFPSRDLRLPAGAAFCAYTDGLTDRHHDPSSVDGRHLLRVAAEAFSRLDGEPSAHLLAEAITGDMLEGAAPDDDVCLAVLFAGG